MWQSFAAIGLGASEMWLRKKEKKTSAVKHKPVRNGGSGRPNNLELSGSENVVNQ